jgi:hypothetical protein
MIINACWWNTPKLFLLITLLLKHIQANNEQVPTKITTFDAQAISKLPHVGNT